MTAMFKPVTAQRRVLSCAVGSARLQAEGYEQEARVALSCLIVPEPGDAVAVQEIEGVAWITAILERTGDAPMQILTLGDLSIASAHGKLRIDAGSALEFSAPALQIQAGTARFFVRDWQQFGATATYYVEKIRSVGKVLEQFTISLLTRARSAIRFVEESDALRAGEIDHRAETTLQLRAKTAFVTADDLVRVDANQIHMG